jgi:hypothetical protein
MAHHTKKEELKTWAEGAGEGKTISSSALIRLIRDAKKLHDLDEIYEYMGKQPDEGLTVEDMKLMLAHCATDCADKDFDIAKRDKEISDLKKQLAELEADKPN